MERQELSGRVYSLELISKYRNALMGLATLSVLILHIHHNFELPMPDALAYIYESGADMFMFLSGFGLFYSAENGFAWGNYLKKRFLRVYPEYIFSVFYFRIILTRSLKNFLLDLFTVSFWVYAFPNYWYVAAIAVLYLLYPFVHKKIRQSDRFTLILIMISILLNVVMSFTVPDFYSARALAFQRVPVFIAGAFIAKKIKIDHKGESEKWPLICAFTAVASLLLALVAGSYYRFLLLPWTIGIAFLMSLLLSVLREKNIFAVLLNFMGKISLPVYLYYTFITQTLVRVQFLKTLPVPVMIVLSVAVTIVVSRITVFLCDCFRKCIPASNSGKRTVNG